MSALQMPPHSVDAEHAVLGALLYRNDMLDVVDGVVAEDDFYFADHRVIFRHATTLIRANRPADWVTVIDSIKRAGDSIQDEDTYLGWLERSAGTSNVRVYAKIIREKAILRKTAQLCWDTAEKAMTPGQHNPTEIIDAAQQELSSLIEGVASDDPIGFVDTLPGYVEEQERRQKGIQYHIRTGLHDLDSRIGGFEDGELIIIGGRPGMGKTGFMLHIAESNAAMDYPVLVISLEMKAMALKDRLIAKRANIPMDVVLGKVSRTQNQHQKILDEANRLVQLPIRFGEMSSLNIERLRAMVRRAKRKFGIRLVIVDYLQLMEGGGEENRTAEVSKVSRGLKTLAMECSLPLIALTQLNRKLEDRPNKRPRLSDIRESGSIEQDADMVMFLYRDEVYCETSPSAGVAEISLAKQRQGSTGTAYVQYNGAYQSFNNLAREWTAPAPSSVRSMPRGFGGDE